MKQTRILKSAMAAIFTAGIGISSSVLAAPSLDEMWNILQKQQKEIEALKKENAQLSEQVEVTSEMAEQAATKKGSQGHGLNTGNTSIGGYGELHYNNLDSKQKFDFHRFVLFLGHEFDDRTRFFSELEVEHSGVESDGDPLGGEVELEQAYIEHDFTDNLSAKAGLFLVPVGIMNETHEPPAFYGVERNPVEKNIIPATWWEAGAGLSGKIGDMGLSYDLAIHSGLETPTTGSSAYKPRNGRRKVSNANGYDLAYTGRIRWTGMPGLELGAAVNYQEDLTQGQGAAGTSSSATMFEAHGIYQTGPFSLKALYTAWDMDGAGPASTGRDEQTGWYIEPSYKVLNNLGVFARYNEWDNNAGSGSTTDTKNKQTDIGLNYWLHENVVFKADYQDQSGAASDDGFNLGVGYMF